VKSDQRCVVDKYETEARRESRDAWNEKETVSVYICIYLHFHSFPAEHTGSTRRQTFKIASLVVMDWLPLEYLLAPSLPT
jgi:hypothetical protein